MSGVWRSLDSRGHRCLAEGGGPPRLVALAAAVGGRGMSWSARDVLDAVFVRPALVYGREHAVWGSFFGPVLEAGEEGRGGGDGEFVRIPLEAG